MTWNRKGCKQRVCICHDDSAQAFYCGHCGCRPLIPPVKKHAKVFRCPNTECGRFMLFTRRQRKTALWKMLCEKCRMPLGRDV